MSISAVEAMSLMAKFKLDFQASHSHDEFEFLKEVQRDDFVCEFTRATDGKKIMIHRFGFEKSQEDGFDEAVENLRAAVESGDLFRGL